MEIFLFKISFAVQFQIDNKFRNLVRVVKGTFSSVVVVVTPGGGMILPFQFFCKFLIKTCFLNAYLCFILLAKISTNKYVWAHLQHAFVDICVRNVWDWNDAFDLWCKLLLTVFTEVICQTVCMTHLLSMWLFKETWDIFL